MPPRNVDRLRRVYAEWERGNFRAGGELFADEIVFVPAVDAPPESGRDAVAAYMRDFLSQWDEFTVSAEEFVDGGETVLVTERQTGTGRESGVATEMVFYAAWSFRDGEVVRVRWLTDRAEATAAIED